MKSIMNKIRLAAFMATVAILAGGCEKESDNTVDNTPVAARITSTIDGMATRAAGTAWAAGDAIGVSGVSGEKPYVNVKYVTTDGDGTFTVVNNAGEDNNIYFQNKDDVTFTAYYPYSGENGTAPGTSANGILHKIIIDADQTPDAQPQIDYLFATCNSTNPNVKFQFHHCMSRLVINFLPGNGITSLSDIKYTIGALVLEGTFNTGTGETAGTATGDLTLSVPSNTSNISSTLIVFPQQANSATIIITMKDMQYSGTIDFPDNPANNNVREFAPGRSYTYNITVHDTELTISSANIEDWEGGGNPIDGGAFLE